MRLLKRQETGVKMKASAQKTQKLYLLRGARQHSRQTEDIIREFECIQKRTKTNFEYDEQVVEYYYSNLKTAEVTAYSLLKRLTLAQESWSEFLH